MGFYVRILVTSLLVVFVAGSATWAEIVTPASVTATSSFVALPENLIDGSGLDGIGNVEDQLHDTDELNMWISGTTPPPQDQELEFTLDLNYDLSDAIIWNFNGVSLRIVSPQAEQATSSTPPKTQCREAQRKRWRT